MRYGILTIVIDLSLMACTTGLTEDDVRRIVSEYTVAGPQGPSGPQGEPAFRVPCGNTGNCPMLRRGSAFPATS